MVKTLATAGSAVTAAATGFGVLAPSPALAVKGTDKVNASLKAYVFCVWSILLVDVVVECWLLSVFNF